MHEGRKSSAMALKPQIIIEMSLKENSSVPKLMIAPKTHTFNFEISVSN
jgi:hypothetical protein